MGRYIQHKNIQTENKHGVKVTIFYRNHYNEPSFILKEVGGNKYTDGYAYETLEKAIGAVNHIEQSKIIVEKFSVIAKQQGQKQSFTLCEIKPDGKFEFNNKEDFSEFKNELRQTFEFVCPFGCDVLAFDSNQRIV